LLGEQAVQDTRESVEGLRHSLRTKRERVDLLRSSKDKEEEGFEQESQHLNIIAGSDGAGVAVAATRRWWIVRDARCSQIARQPRRSRVPSTPAPRLPSCIAPSLLPSRSSLARRSLFPTPPRSSATALGPINWPRAVGSCAMSTLKACRCSDPLQTVLARVAHWFSGSLACRPPLNSHTPGPRSRAASVMSTRDCSAFHGLPTRLLLLSIRAPSASSGTLRPS
jgi:hypothetical protein